MNERIRQLAKLADPDYTGIGEFDLGDCLLGNHTIEKFAQLIVEECIASIPSDGHRGDFLRGVEFCQLKIKAQFGIAE